MKTVDFINEHINIEKNVTENKQFLFKIEKYKKYVYYLELLTKIDVKTIIKDILINEVICRQSISEKIKHHKYKYYVGILLYEELIEYCNPNKRLTEIYEEFIGEYNFSKMAFYRLTKKGNDLLKTNKIKKYILENE